METEVWVKVKLDATEVADSVYNNLMVSPWVVEYDWDWQDPERANKPVTVKCWNPEADEYDADENLLTEVIAIDRLVGALSRVVSENKYHCGQLVGLDLEDWDACCADLVIQMALYNEIVFG
jgi:hypothetical protein